MIEEFDLLKVAWLNRSFSEPRFKRSWGFYSISVLIMYCRGSILNWRLWTPEHCCDALKFQLSQCLRVAENCHFQLSYDPLDPLVLVVLVVIYGAAVVITTHLVIVVVTGTSVFLGTPSRSISSCMNVVMVASSACR